MMVGVKNTASGKGRETENFPVGSFLIRPDLRTHIHALYNFARAADDISDHPLLDAQEKITQLEQFAITLLDEKKNSVPTAVALRKSLRETGISPQHSLDLLIAFKRDATQLRYRDWYDLLDYCTFSAAPVGRHILALHGIGSEAWKASDALCNALQVINHMQDCGDDYRQLDRVYLPLDILNAHGAKVTDLSHEISTPGLKATLQALLVHVEALLRDAHTIPHLVPDARLKCEVSVIYTLAQRLTSLLRKRDPLCDIVKLGKPQAIAATLVGVVRAWI